MNPESLVEVRGLPIASQKLEYKLTNALTMFFTRHGFTPVDIWFYHSPRHPARPKDLGPTNGTAIVALSSRMEVAYAIAKLNNKYLMPAGKANKLRVAAPGRRALQHRIPSSVNIAFNPQTGLWSFTKDGKSIKVAKAYTDYLDKNTIFTVEGATFDSLPEELKRDISAYIPLNVIGVHMQRPHVVPWATVDEVNYFNSENRMHVVDKHTAASLRPAMIKRRAIADEKLYKAVGLLRTEPDEALRLVKKHIKDANPNASVLPWLENIDNLGKTNILLRIILDKFRPYYGQEAPANFEVGVLAGGGPARRAERNKVDTARHEIIKILLDNGAIFNEETIDAAFTMRDLGTALELERRQHYGYYKGPLLQYGDFWNRGRMEKPEYQGQGRYFKQSINGEVKNSDYFEEQMGDPYPFG